MSYVRREVFKALGLALVAASVERKGEAAGMVQGAGDLTQVKALAFDAYGTLFDVFSVTALCDRLFPGKGNALAQLWRAKQLQYSLLRSLMGRHRDFWRLTEDGLAYAAKSLNLALGASERQQLMDAYLTLAAFPDVKPGLQALKSRGIRLAVLSNGEPRMLQAAVTGAGLDQLLDAVISIEDVQIFKPSPRVYALASSRLGVPTAQIGFVSSNSWDINGAASAGLFTLWIQRNAAEPPEELGYAAGRVVQSLTEVAAIIGRS